jgi:predicted ATPase
VRLLHGTDREDDARYALTALYQTFTEGHATRDLQEAAALLNAS